MMPGLNALTRNERSTVTTTSGESLTGTFLGLEVGHDVMAVLLLCGDETLTLPVTEIAEVVPAGGA